MKRGSRNSGPKKSAVFALTKKVNATNGQSLDDGEEMVSQTTISTSKRQNLTPIIITPMHKTSVKRIAKEAMGGGTNESDGDGSKIGSSIKNVLSNIGIERVAKIIIIVVIISLLTAYQRQWFNLGGAEQRRKNYILATCAIGSALLVAL